MDKESNNKSPSQMEIARIAGVSRTTVSFVLNNIRGKNISEETRQKVLEVAQTVGYKPVESAVDTATSREGAVSLFVCHSDSVFSDAYIMRLLESMEPLLHKRRYDLRVVQFRVSRNDYLEIAQQKDFKGVILLNMHSNDEGISNLKNSGLPFVVIGSLPDPDLCQVDIDNAEAARKAAEYLLSLGHHNIGIIAHASEAFLAVKARLSGFFEALEAAGVSVPEGRIRFAHFSEESGYSAMCDMLAAGKAPSAIFATNDMVAYGAIRALEDSGFNVPRDVSVIGFDDDYMSRYTNPPLTTITLPAEGIGRKAAEILLRRMDSGRAHHGITILPTSLTIRRSCREVS
ncbi:MAG: LacI family transcriptional regulator [Spirochaetaceae bacterium]|nr:LacI family transcriptional regulator [Spirochaetaceae bacterium]